ncbi:MAG: SCO family protein [Pseudomonadota bacterium]
MAIVFLCCLILACNTKTATVFRNTDITGASFGKNLALTDHHGAPRTLADFQGKAVILFFGYTACPDICPSTLTRFAAVRKQLGSDASKIQVLFVTLDPARDTQERLAAYVPWFDSSFIGLYGDEAKTKAVASEFNIFYAKQDTGSAAGYALDHTAGAYAFDPAGRIRLYIKDDASIDSISSDLKNLLAGN